MEQAIEEAVVIEEALKFGGEVSEVNVNAIQKKEDSAWRTGATEDTAGANGEEN